MLSAAVETRPYRPDTPSSNGNGKEYATTNGAVPARVPPHSIDAERSLLGAMLLSRDAIYAAIEVVTGASFYKPAHSYIFDAIVGLAESNEPADVVTVSDELRRAGFLEPAGGIEALNSLQIDTPATSNAGRYAKTIAGHHQLRQLIAIAGEIAEVGYHPGSDPTTALDHAESLIFGLGDRAGVIGEAAQQVGDALAGWMDILEDRYRNGPTGVPTGIVDLDDTLAGGMRAGDLHFIAARPAMGKTQIGVQIGYYAAAETAVPTLVIEAEMPTPQLMDRIVASRAKVDLQRIRTGRLKDGDWPRITGAVAQITDVPLWIYAAADITLADIRAQARRVAVQARRPLGLIVIDYLQLLQGDVSDNRQLEVDKLARGLKMMAKSFGVPVLALCQVNRNVESRADKRPLLSDLRESGGIEAHGDVVVALYRDEVYNPDSADRGTAELIVLKQRNGPLKTVNVAYLAQYGLFANMARM